MNSVSEKCTLKTKSTPSTTSLLTSLPCLPLLCPLDLLFPPELRLRAATPAATPRAAAPRRPAAPSPRAAAWVAVRVVPVKAGIVKVRAPVLVNVESPNSRKVTRANRAQVNKSEALILSQLTCDGKFQRQVRPKSSCTIFIGVQCAKCTGRWRSCTCGWFSFAKSWRPVNYPDNRINNLLWSSRGRRSQKSSFLILLCFTN